MQQWMQAYRQQLEDLIDFCVRRETRELTPSDFAYQEVSFDDLATLTDLFN